jgi:hypothetical protein
MISKNQMRNKVFSSFERLELRELYTIDLGYCTAAEFATDIVAAELTLQMDSNPSLTEEVYGPMLLSRSHSSDQTPTIGTGELHPSNLNQVYEMDLTTPESPISFVVPNTPSQQMDALIAELDFDSIVNLLVSEGEGESPETGPSSSLTPDQQRALALCGDDQACRDSLLELFEVVDNSLAPPWFSIETITFGGRCVWWTTHTHSDILDTEQGGVDLGGIGVTEDWRRYIGPNPLWSEHHFLTVTLPNGNVFYMDVYWLGGSDHVFFELPSSLVDKDGYAAYCDRNAGTLSCTYW